MGSLDFWKIKAPKIQQNDCKCLALQSQPRQVCHLQETRLLSLPSSKKSQLCTWALLLSAVGNHEEAIENGALK